MMYTPDYSESEIRQTDTMLKGLAACISSIEHENSMALRLMNLRYNALYQYKQVLELELEFINGEDD